MDLTPEERAQDVRPFAELRDSGLLWLINRVVFHPRGFALALTVNKETGEAVGWKLLGDGSEVWRFDGDEDDLYERAQRTLMQAAIPDVDAVEPLADWERELLYRQRWIEIEHQRRYSKSPPTDTSWIEIEHQQPKPPADVRWVKTTMPDALLRVCPPDPWWRRLLRRPSFEYYRREDNS